MSWVNNFVKYICELKMIGWVSLCVVCEKEFLFEEVVVVVVEFYW